MNYFIKIYSNKPKEDINEIVESMGYRNIAPQSTKSSGLAHFLIKLGTLFCILARMKRNDMLLIQYPYKKFFTPTCICAHLKGAKVVTLIHDLGSFRRKRLTPQHENRRLSHSDYIIAHNESMRDFLLQHGCKRPVSCLGIFDYLSSSTPATYTTPHKPWNVIYAGGLSHSRNAYIYELDQHITNWQFNLYGKQFQPELAAGWQHIHYKGQLPPDELIATVESDFGLVWDGHSLTECAGAWGEYLKINNPHKTSFYLRAGIPVIIWKKAALAPFVESHNIGLTVDTLDEIDERLKSLSAEEYRQLRVNAQRMQNQLATGTYTRDALLLAEHTLSSVN